MSYVQEARDIIERLIPFMGERTLMMSRDGKVFLQDGNDRKYGYLSDFFQVNNLYFGKHIWYIDFDKNNLGQFFIRTRYMESSWKELSPLDTRSWFSMELTHD